jgi:hypothetical protein
MAEQRPAAGLEMGADSRNTDPRWRWDGQKWLWWDGQRWTVPAAGQPGAPPAGLLSNLSTPQKVAAGGGGFVAVLTIVGGVLTAAFQGGAFSHQSISPTAAAASSPPAAVFQLVDDSFQGPCDDSGCPVTATFENRGGPGSASATFTILAADKSTELATCSAPITNTPANGSNTASCKAYSATLMQYFADYLDSSVFVQVDIKNPSG